MSSLVKSKLFILGAIVVALSFFLNLTQNLIAERQQVQQQAVRSISQSTVQPQTLIGPLLFLSCTERFVDSLNKREFNLTVAPQTLSARMQSNPDNRKRGIFSSPVIQTQSQFKASFDPAPDVTAARSARKDSSVSCNPTLFVSLSDPRGIRHASVKLGEQTQTLKSGTPHFQHTKGLQLALPTLHDTRMEAFSLEMGLDFLSHQSISIVPVAQSSTWNMSSNWSHPSFSGQIAPDSRQLLGPQGFNAEWRVTSIATNAAQKASQNRSVCAAASASNEYKEKPESADDCMESIQIHFIEPINTYSLSERASKYGLLFVVFTFVAVGLFEVMKQLRVHPMQYLLVGAAVCMFFLLLVSLSEHIGFARAYASGTAATVVLLTYYASYILGSLWRGLPFGAGIALLYALLYVLLQLEQTALAVGSVALFVVLAIVMVSTRKIDWYALLGSSSAQQSLSKE
jgi:inner membrane protein